jgi:adenine deaminase
MARARLRTIVGARFTRWGEVEADVVDGRVVPPAEASLMAVVHRHGRAPGVPRLAIVEDWGVWQGAFATTVSHDSHNLVVFGRDPRDMAAAANAVIADGGGMADARLLPRRGRLRRRRDRRRLSRPRRGRSRASATR